MLKRLRKVFSLILVVLIVVISMAPMSMAAVTYPQNVTKDQLTEAIGKTDTIIFSLIKSMEDKTLNELVLPQIYSGDTLSALTTGIYSMLEENAEVMSSIGIDVSVPGVIVHLSAYPDVVSKLSQYSKWSEVSLEGADWDVSDKQSFSIAAGAVLAPFNDILYMLLCGGTFSLNSVIGLEGAKGYETAIIPTLKAIGCESITDSGVFYADAENNKNTMVEHLVSDLFTFVESLLDAPVNKLTEILPGIAYFLNNGGFDDAVANLIEPLRLQIFNISTFIKVELILSFIQNSEAFTQGFTMNFNDILSGTGLKMAEIDLEELASCGTVSGNTVISDQADTFLVLLRWLIDTMKLNKDSLSGMTESENTAQMGEMIDGFISKDTDELISLIIGFLCAEGAKVNNYQWTFADFTATQVTYTPNLGQDKFQRVVDGIDDLINEFIAEGGEHETVREALGPEIYSSSLVTQLVKGVYGMFESEEMKMIGEMTGLYVTPSALANELREGRFSSARYALSRASKWSSVGNVNWGFRNGNKDGFVEAVSAALRPLEPMLGMLLAEGKMQILGAIDIYGSNGYNTAIIPLLEAIGCSVDSIKTYDEFKTAVSKGEGMKSIMVSLTSLIERVLDKPVYTITEILPNFLYFMENGGFESCINNLLYPFSDMMKQLGMEDMLDMSGLTDEMDMETMMAEMMGNADLGVDFSDFDIKQFMSMGTLVTVESKRTYQNQPVSISYIKADQTAIMVTLLRYIVEMIKAPGNENMLMGFMGGSGGSDDMMASFSGGIGQELAAMSTDETVEWLYKIFFRERAVVPEEPKEDYLPTIIYTPAQAETEGTGVFVFMLFVALAEVVAIKKRNKIESYLEDRKIRKNNKSEKALQEV